MDRRALIHADLDRRRGKPPGGFRQKAGQPPPIRGLSAYNRAGAYLTPELLNNAERAQWFSATARDNSGTFNTELGGDKASDTLQYHQSEPGLDYNSYVTDMVLDPRTRLNHQHWAREMAPYSGTAMMVDDMDEALEATTSFTGLRRPQAVAQDNPWQLTERDANTFIGNTKFNFRG